MKTIINFIKNIFAKLRYAFMSSELKNIINSSIAVVQKIKEALASGTADLIVSLTKTDIDDKILAKIKEILPTVLAELNLIPDLLNEKDITKVINVVLAELNKLDVVSKNEYFQKIAVLITTILADGRFDINDFTSIVEWVYQNIFKK